MSRKEATQKSAVVQYRTKAAELRAEQKKMIEIVHEDIVTACLAMLHRNKLVIYEQAIIRADVRKFRRDLDWKLIREKLEATLKHPLIACSRAELRNLINPAHPNCFNVSTEIHQALKFGNGNQTAGFALLDYDRNLAERKAGRLEHIGNGFYAAGTNIRDNLVESEQFRISHLDSDDVKS